MKNKIIIDINKICNKLDGWIKNMMIGIGIGFIILGFVLVIRFAT